MKKKPELLSPAGSYDIFRAVLSAGADAVYAGMKRYSARAYADNFTDEEILRAMDEAHLRGRRFYLAVNTLIKDSEMTDALRTVEQFYESGLDAVILQDPGLSREIARRFPDLERHASTQMTVTGSYGMRLLEESGFTQAVLPREMSLDEIRETVSRTSLDCECFIHGALCYCYSGKCLMSSVIGGRSANRGRCAQPCRLPYEVVIGAHQSDRPQMRRAGASKRGRSGGASNTKRGRYDTSDGPQTYPLSLKDLCAAPTIRDLIEAGVVSFKIEGRMKGPEYAAGTTQIYRTLIDEAVEEIKSWTLPAAAEGGSCGGAPDAQEKAVSQLTDLGSRSGFTNGYIAPAQGECMVTMEKPSHHRSEQSDTVRQVRERISGAQEKIPADLEIRIFVNEPVRLSMTAGGHTVTVSGEAAQAAQDRPLSEETVREKLTRLGETPFEVSKCRIDLEAGAFVPVSGLNRLRREAVQALTESFRPHRQEATERTEKSRDDELRTAEKTAEGTAFGLQDAAEETAGRLPVLAFPTGGKRQSGPDDAVRGIRDAGKSRPDLYVSVFTDAQLHEVLRQPETDAVILDCDAFPPGVSLTEAAALIHEAGKECILAMPHTFRPDTARRWRAWAPDGPDGYEIRCIDEAAFLNDPALFAHRPFILASEGIYAWNAHAAEALREMGIDLLSVPRELRESEAVGRGFVLTIYGRAELMVSAQCVRRNTAGCRRDSDEAVFLKDRKGRSFPVRTLCGSCENVIYNCVPTVLFSDAVRILQKGFAGYRMDFLSEDPGEIREIFRQYRLFAEGKKETSLDQPFTYGAWKRGTL